MLVNVYRGARSLRGILVLFALLVGTTFGGGRQDVTPTEEAQRLVEAIGTDREGGQYESMKALIALGDVAVEPCLKALNDADAGFVCRWQCAKVLGWVNAVQAAPDLLRIAVSDPMEMVSVVAFEALGRIGGDEVRTDLEALLDQKLSARRRDSLERALRKLGSTKVPASPAEAPPTVAWTQPAIVTGTPFVEALPWAADLETALELAAEQGKLVLATVVPIGDTRWSSGYRAAPAVWRGAGPHPWGDMRAMQIDAGLVKERVFMAALFSDPEIAHLVREHFIPVRVRLHTFHFDGDGVGPDPLVALGTTARELGGPSLVFTHASGKLLHSCKRMSVLSAPMMRSMLRGVLAQADVTPAHWWTPASALGLDLAWAAVRRGDLEQARALLGLDPAEPTTHRYFESLYLRGHVAEALGDHVGALGFWAIARRGSPEGPWGGKAGLRESDRGPRIVEWETLLTIDAEKLPNTTEVGVSRRSLPLAIAGAVRYLLHQQRADGGWQDPWYDMSPRAGPGSRYDMTVARTGLVVDSLIAARTYDAALSPDVDAAIDRGVARVGRFADAPEPHVWQLTYALHLQIALLRAKVGDQAVARERAARLVSALSGIQADGGWSYMPSPRIHSFNTAPVLLLLTEAVELGVEVPPDMMQSAAEFLESLRVEDEPRNFAYAPTMPFPLRASSCRTALCELALSEHSGEPATEALTRGVALFFEFEPEVRSTTKIYEAYFSVRSLQDAYHYYFGHYYVARCLSHLPGPQARTWARRQEEIVLAQRELDGSFVDAQMQGKSYSTAMALLTLLEDERILR